MSNTCLDFHIPFRDEDQSKQIIDELIALSIRQKIFLYGGTEQNEATVNKHLFYLIDVQDHKSNKRENYVRYYGTLKVLTNLMERHIRCEAFLFDDEISAEENNHLVKTFFEDVVGPTCKRLGVAPELRFNIPTN